MKNKFKSLIALILCSIIIVSILNLVTTFDKPTSKVVTNNINNINPTELNLSNNKIKELQEYYSNTDIKGILTIDTLDNFSYPITQTSNNDYYLNHDYYKNYDSYGAIYADYRVNLDNSDKVLIFGHSSTKKNIPFNELENYYDEEYYQKHKYITLETETNTYRYEIFSVYVETSDFTYMNLNFDTANDWYTHILKLQSKSLYQIDVDLNQNDNILILQTCSNNKKYKNNSKKYLLIVSRRVK